MTVVPTLTLIAYIGPGGGVALLGPLLGVILAVLGAVAMIAFWPIRMWLKKMKSRNAKTSVQGNNTKPPIPIA